MSDMVVEIKRRLFTVAEYHRLYDEGFLSNDRDRLELIEGELIEMPPIGQAHFARHGRIAAYLARAFHEVATVIPMGSFRLDDRSEPQPDLAILPFEIDGYERRALPSPGEFFGFVEIADSSFAYDAGPKMRLYARHGVSDYLLVDVRGNRLLVHRDPTPEGYAHVARLTYGQTFCLTNVPDVALVVDEFLAPQDREVR